MSARTLWRSFKRWFGYRRTPEPTPIRVVVPHPPVIPSVTTPPPVEITKDDIKKRTLMYYEYLYSNMVVKQDKAVEYVVARIEKNRDRYKSAEILTGVDWRIIGAIHNMEASGNFDCQILNGEKWWKRTKLVPKKKGPWTSWEDSCIDAFGYHKLSSNNIGDVLKFGEKFNGLGYIRKGINSPYIWSYSSHYTKGKYVRDGYYSSTAVSKQVGMAPILKGLGY